MPIFGLRQITVVAGAGGLTSTADFSADGTHGDSGRIAITAVDGQLTVTDGDVSATGAVVEANGIAVTSGKNASFALKNGSGGFLASNYTLNMAIGGATQVNILKTNLMATLRTQSKAYDGNRNLDYTLNWSGMAGDQNDANSPCLRCHDLSLLVQQDSKF